MLRILWSLCFLFLVCQGQQTLRVETAPPYEPFEFFDKNGTLVGFDVDILEAIASAAGFQLNISQLSSFDDTFPLILNGTNDLDIDDLNITPIREMTFDFSVPYFISIDTIMALNDTNITDFGDLVTQKIGLLNGSATVADVLFFLGDNDPNIAYFETYQEGFDAIANRTIDAFIDDIGMLSYYANNNPGFVLIVDTNAFSREFSGLLFPKGSPYVKEVNQAITTILTDGTYTSIHEKWFGTVPDTALLLQAGNSSDPYAIFATVLNFTHGNETTL